MAEADIPAVKTRSFDPPHEPEWHRRIAEAAYLRAERRGFTGGSPLEDWLAAEEAVRHTLAPKDPARD